MKKGIGILLLIGLIWGISYYRNDGKGRPVLVTIAPGQSGSSAAKQFKSRGIIRSQSLFKLALKLNGGLPAGSFDLRPKMSEFQALKCMKDGRCTHYEKITFLEGWRSEEMAEELASHSITDGNEFLRMVRQQKLEGHLFPSTYLFTLNMPAKKVVQEMTAQYEKNIRPLFTQYPSKLTEQQVLTLASIVEREAVLADEKPKIAAVYLNRFEIGKRLEADPTVQYALGYDLGSNRYWKKRLLFKDLKIDSPYNTYRRSGLPPGPICNPSAASVQAVLRPTPNFNALYFVADSGGRHVFARHYDEHQRNIKRIRGQ